MDRETVTFRFGKSPYFIFCFLIANVDLSLIRTSIFSFHIPITFYFLTNISNK